MIQKIIGLILFSVSVQSFAAQNIKVMALFQDKAILTIDGQRQKLEIGNTVNGVTLLEANSKQAVIKVNGETQTLKLGTGTAVFKEDKNGEVIPKNEGGMFVTKVSINGTEVVPAMVDTGASVVAISRKMADKMHLNYISGETGSARTANGRVRTYEVNLDSIKVGKIELKNVTAVITKSDMEEVLLGMTFLERLQVFHNSNSLTLVAK
jgi:aspartyl protease family protein